jgi:CDP-paratose 2-epimerase
MNIALITGSCGLVGSEASLYFAKKGFKILGIDNNTRKFFFGKDGDISWIKKKLKKDLKDYNHFDIDIRNYHSLKKIFNKYKKKLKLLFMLPLNLLTIGLKTDLLSILILTPKEH